jgi:hypothetical protein
MTRHGTLAYYLAAWVIGCFVVACVFWLMNAVAFGSASSSVLLETCFFALMVGAADSLLFAFFLRHAMHGLGTRNAAIWGLAGAAIAFALVFALAWVSGKLAGSMQQGPAYFLNSFVFAGPDAMWRSGPWQAPMEGAVVAAVLCLVDRAFNPDESTIAARPREPKAEPEAAQTGQSPA